MEQGYCRTNPAKGIRQFAEPRRAEAVSFWTRDEIDAILENVKPYYRDAYEFIYHTGLRKEELIYLTWEDVDIASTEPVIRIQAKEYEPGKHWIPKAKQRRIVPLNQQALQNIQRQVRSETNDWVFHSPGGGYVNLHRFLQVLKEGARAAGTDGTIHKLRHTFASHLVMRGVGLETVSKLLGHSSIEMTMKYAHLAPDDLRRAVDVLISCRNVAISY